jgi:hypothetical protein
MSYDSIRHPERLRQITDFSSFAIRGSDIDFEAEITSDVVVRGEWKFGETPLSGGQSHSAQNWVNRMGVTTYAFYVIASHNVPASEPILAHDLFVKAVLFRTPEMSRAMVVRYDEQHRPQLNPFLSTLAIRFGQDRYINMLYLDHLPLWFFDPVLSAAHDAPLAVQKREKDRLAFQEEFNRNNGLSLSFPPQTIPSEEHRREFLAYDPVKDTYAPLGWIEYLEEGEPSYIVA